MHHQSRHNNIVLLTSFLSGIMVLSDSWYLLMTQVLYTFLFYISWVAASSYQLEFFCIIIARPPPDGINFPKQYIWWYIQNSYFFTFAKKITYSSFSSWYFTYLIMYIKLVCFLHDFICLQHIKFFHLLLAWIYFS